MCTLADAVADAMVMKVDAAETAEVTAATETADAEIMTMKADAAVVTRVVAAVINSL